MQVASVRDAERAVREVQARPREVFIDFETKGLDPYSSESHIAGAAVKVPGGQARYLSFRHPETKNLPTEVLHDLWRAACDVGITNHNLSFDARMAHCREGLPLPTKGRDSWVAMQLENENRLGPTGTRKGAFGLKHRCAVQFGKDAIGAETELSERMIAAGLDPKADLWRVPGSWVAPYACDDVNLVERAFDEWLDPRFEKLGITDLAQEYYDYRHLITIMEVDGMQLDRGLVEQYLSEARREEAALLRSIQDMAGRDDFNPGSHVQLKPWVGLPDTQKWRLKSILGDRNADPEQRAKVDKLWRWRRWSKAAGTYYEPYLERSDASGLLHPSFGFTRTGRLTCFDPNLHATPHYSDEYKMKDCWVAPPGFFILYCDWSQAEMRLCAHYTNDPFLMRAFTEGIDVHTLVSQMLGCDRQTAKPLNYGSAYGMGAKKLAREYGMKESDAKKWLDAYHSKLTGPRNLYKRMGSLAEDKGFIRIWDGRYRRFSNDPRVEAFPHSASNSLLQAGVGAMARKAMLRLKDWCYGNGGKMWIQIHDAVIFCLPLDMRTPETYRHVKHVMEDFPQFRVKIPVDMGEGRTWKEASENKIKVPA